MRSTLAMTNCSVHVLPQHVVSMLHVQHSSYNWFMSECKKMYYLLCTLRHQQK